MSTNTNSVNSPPQEFVCPISMTLMVNPVRSSKTGHCFEREAIMNWIYRGNIVCPLTREPLHPDDLELDTKLQAKILKWNTKEDDSEGGFNDSDADFEAAFQDILEISDRIKSVTVSNAGQRRHSNPLPLTEEEEEDDMPSKRSSTGTVKSTTTRRLSDLRSRVLQQREDRIKDMLSKGGSKAQPPMGPEESQNPGVSSISNISMAARV